VGLPARSACCAIIRAAQLPPPGDLLAVSLEVSPGTTLKMLYVDRVAGERASLMRLEPGSVYPSTTIQNLRNCSTLEGVVNVGDQDYRPDEYTIAQAGSRHEITRSASGGLILLHRNAPAAPA
jgi:hypothetical protein